MEVLAKKEEGLDLMERYERALYDNFDCKDLEAVNLFHDGVFLRVVDMKAGEYVCGHEHKTSHFNIVLSGKAIINMNGEQSKAEAGDIFISEPGCKKGLFIVEDMRWVTIHPNPKNEQSQDDLDDTFIEKSLAYEKYMNSKSISGGEECLGE
jgi:quercetin dioxygenase-like cupin family protein